MVNKIEISAEALRNNLEIFRKVLEPGTQIIAVVKANAYGHGLTETAKILREAGADAFAVATIEEAIDIRLARIQAPVLVINYVPPEEFRRAIDSEIAISIFDFTTAYKLSLEAKKANKTAHVHLKVNTGMNRFGFNPHDLIKEYKEITKLKFIKIEGLYSHFADAKDTKFSEEQLDSMNELLFFFQQNDINQPLIHMAATEGTLLYPEAHFDAVRIGLGLYGHSGLKDKSLGLKSALKLKSQIAQIRQVPEGETIGYKRTYKTPHLSKIAVIPIGYSEGYPRNLSNKSEVLIDGKRARVVGRICMNILMADVTGINCTVGDEVVLLGSQGNASVDADELAELSGTNVHEIISRLSPLLPREYIK